MATEEPASANSLPGERGSFRAIRDPYQSYQDKRRQNALQRQKAARLHSSNRARTLALEPGQQEDDAEERLSLDEASCGEVDSGDAGTADDADMEPSTSYGPCDAPMRGHGRAGRGRGAHAAARRRQQHQHHQGYHGKAAGPGGVRAYGQRYGNELMQPEWMTDVPTDLATNWLVMPRPEGMRCLLVTSRGRTVSWLRNGAPLHRFHSHLPGGSPATAARCGSLAAAEGDYCLLDCIFHAPNNTYYVLDLLCWRGYALYDTAAEFRTFWLASKFREEGLMPPPSPPAAAMAVVAAGSASAPPAAAAAGAAAHGSHAQGGAGAGADADADADMEMDGDGADGRSGFSRPGRRQQQEQPTPSASYRIVPLPVRPCTLQGLRAAYGRVPPPPAAADVGVAAASTAADGADPWVTFSAAAAADMEEAATAAGSEAAEFDFLRDGLYFLHRQGHYCPGSGTTPLALLWKDLGCSRYLIDTDARGQPLEHQAVVLSYRADRTVATEDEPPVVLGKLPEAFVAAMGTKLGPGRLLRFSIRQGGITFHEGRPAGADLQYEGPANQRRGRADSFSKILFQRLARTAPITAASLAAAVLAGPQPSAEGAAAVEAAPRDVFGNSLEGGGGGGGLGVAAAAGPAGGWSFTGGAGAVGGANGDMGVE